MTSPKLSRMYDDRRTCLQAAYDVCPGLEAVVKAAIQINTFAWSSMTADCNEARDEANERLADLKAALAELEKAK